MPHSFKDLRAWQVAMKLAELVYKKTESLPKTELYGLVNQMRRAAVSIPSNIAEGCGRGTDAQLAHFLNIAQGSAFELETQTLLSQRLGFLTQDQIVELLEKADHVERLIFNLNKTLSNKTNNV